MYEPQKRAAWILCKKHPNIYWILAKCHGDKHRTAVRKTLKKNNGLGGALT
jgi:hypothetical protein